MDITIRARLIAQRHSHITTLVFQNHETFEYTMCSYYSNWKEPIPPIGEVGFLSYEEVFEGQKYICSKTNEPTLYKRTDCVFKKFIAENNQKNNDINIILA
jgi:hypothetical protein